MGCPRCDRDCPRGHRRPFGRRRRRGRCRKRCVCFFSVSAMRIPELFESCSTCPRSTVSWAYIASPPTTSSGSPSGENCDASLCDLTLSDRRCRQSCRKAISKAATIALVWVRCLPFCFHLHESLTVYASPVFVLLPAHKVLRPFLPQRSVAIHLRGRRTLAGHQCPDVHDLSFHSRRACAVRRESFPMSLTRLTRCCFCSKPLSSWNGSFRAKSVQLGSMPIKRLLGVAAKTRPFGSHMSKNGPCPPSPKLSALLKRPTFTNGSALP
jgi:hypothetical protein